MYGEPSAGLLQASGVQLSYSPCSAFMKLSHPIPGSDLTGLVGWMSSFGNHWDSVWLLEWTQTRCRINPHPLASVTDTLCPLRVVSSGGFADATLYIAGPGECWPLWTKSLLYAMQRSMTEIAQGKYTSSLGPRVCQIQYWPASTPWVLTATPEQWPKSLPHFTDSERLFGYHRLMIDSWDSPEF